MGCIREPAPGPGPDPNDSIPIAKSNSELLCIEWLVDEAYVDGNTPDLSSKGLRVEFNSAGTYTVFLKDGSSFNGDWKFLENETKIDIDEGGQFHQTWTIQELDESKLDVKFISPFTAQNAQWFMIPN
jgi:hypothetical protein